MSSEVGERGERGPSTPGTPGTPSKPRAPLTPQHSSASEDTANTGSPLKRIVVNPMEFEAFVTGKRTILSNDPLREMLLYPPDDVSCVVLPRRWRTVNTTVPDARSATACPLLTRQALLSYASSWNLVHYKYAAYSGSHLDLPRSVAVFDLKEDAYEIDVDADAEDKCGRSSKSDSVAKQGHLLKGPEIGSDRLFVNLGSKSFKKRYCYLRQEPHGSYFLDVHKDEKHPDAKLSISIDCCSEVIRNPKRCRNCFEIKMEPGTKGYAFATETESELEEWISAILTVLQNSKPEEIITKNDKEGSNAATPAPPAILGTLKGLEHSMNPQLISYAKETDASIALSRTYARNNLFTIPPNAPVTNEPQLEPFKEQFGQRILLKCESVKFRLQAPIDGEKEQLCQVEPYYTYLALFDSRNGKKLTENFYFDLNHDAVRDIMVDQVNFGFPNKSSELEPKLDLKTLPCDWFKSKKQAVLSINNPHPDIFIVVRIDKVLQGNINQISEPYVKATKDPRLGLKVHKTVRSYASRLGTYRMPFAWTAKPLFRLYSNELDTGPDFPGIYRQEPGRMSDDDLLKILSDFRKQDKMSKLTLIPGWVKINIFPCADQPPNSLTCNWAPVKPFPMPPTAPCSLELANINTSLENPHSSYINHIYVHPMMLNFDSQKVFARARNIACHVEIRDNDTQGCAGLNLIYGIDGMVNKKICSVVHHNTCPAWFDEIKICLPVYLSTSHHLLFTFYHVSCDISKKTDCGIESCVGYSWIPLLTKNGKLVDEIVNLPIATHLASGYLSIQPLGLGRGNSGPETVWIDGEKPLFRCNITIDSTVLTRDAHLQNLFAHAEKLVQPQIGAMPPETETCKILKAAHAIQLTTLIQFLPTIFNQLFEILAMVQGTSDVGVQVVRLMVHLVHMICDIGRKDLVESYIKYVFLCVGNGIHEHLMAPLHSFVESSQQDFLLGHKFMQHSSFFFQIITKSMAQYLINTGRIKMCRTERFPESFNTHIEKLIDSLEPSYILQQPVQTHCVNKNVAIFLKKCLNFMDRGFVFRQIKKYIEKFKLGDPKALFDFKFTFIQIVCQHEHYVPFNLPLQHSRLSSKEWCNENDTSPSETFLNNHFLAGILLKHVHLSLNEAPQKRKLALSTLRELLSKHELDDRYKGKASHGRIASLYAPWLPIVCENVHRLMPKELITETATHKSNIELNNDGTLPLPKDTSLSHNICTPKRNRLTLHFEQPTPVRNSTHFKDSTFFVPLASNYGNGDTNGASNVSLDSDVSTMSGETALGFDSSAFKLDSKETSDSVNRFGVLSKDEVRDVLFCFLFVLKYIEDGQLIDMWGNFNAIQLQSFFNILELCAEQFNYPGKKKILSDCKTNGLDIPGKSKPLKARTLPARMSPPDFSKEPPSMPDNKNNTVNRENMLSINKEKDNSIEHNALMAGWLTTEVGLTIIDRVCLFTEHFDALNGIAAKPYLTLLEQPQSETLYKHLFAALRAYINKFSDTLFTGNGVLCGNLVNLLLKACDSRLFTLRQEAAAMLYLLMRGNFEHTHRMGLTRIHLQVIIGVSKMLGSVVTLNNTRFQESLSLINSFAGSDKVMKGSGFPSEVKELTRRIRTVLIATEEMIVHGGGGGWSAEQERLAELQHTLAISYRATPRLRHAWLDTMAQHHNRAGNYAESMCCHLHIAALISEYLKLRGCQSWGAEAFSCISSNIARDETGLKIDAGMVDVQYSEQGLLEQLELCTAFVEKAERYELLGPLYRFILPIHEKNRNYDAIIRCYQHLHEAYTKVQELQHSGRRMLGRYYRVAFYGQAYFEDENKMEYVYKEPKLTSLSEISERLNKLYEQKFGTGVVRMVMDSAPVNEEELDSRYAYIQVTSLQPHFDCSELTQERITDFERNHDIRRFMYETPFTQDGKARGNIDEQWKRQTILTTESSFPYVKKRILVSDTCSDEKSPIEVALEQIQGKIAELNEIVNAKTYDAKKLQLRLQGSICVQVNAGPLAYATAFLDPVQSKKYPDSKVKQLKDVFRDFLLVCRTALQINSKLISSDQQEYQEALEQNYRKVCDSLVSLIGENIVKIHNGTATPVTKVVGAQVDSSTA